MILIILRKIFYKITQELFLFLHINSQKRERKKKTKNESAEFVLINLSQLKDTIYTFTSLYLITLSNVQKKLLAVPRK